MASCMCRGCMCATLRGECSMWRRAMERSPTGIAMWSGKPKLVAAAPWRVVPAFHVPPLHTTRTASSTLWRSAHVRGMGVRKPEARSAVAAFTPGYSA